MSRKWTVAVLLATGIAWGLSEVFLGDVFYRFQIPMRAAALTAIGMAILVAGRLVSDKPGSSLAAALMAGAIRCLVPKLYICHFVAIALEGCVFDASWTAFKAGERYSLKKAWLSSAIGAYAGFLAFAFTGAYIFGFGRWVAAGPGGILEFSLKSGTFSAILLAGLVPLAALAARKAVAVRRRSEHTSPLGL
jgi:hypothetical protein